MTTTATAQDAADLDKSDLLNLEGLLSEVEIQLRDKVRAFVDERFRPSIADWYENAHFPVEIVREMGELGLLGMHLHGYGCPGRSAVEYGLAAMELEAGDSGLRTFVAFQGSLAMSAIHKFGSEIGEEPVPAGHGQGRDHRLLRPDRAHRRIRPGIDGYYSNTQ